MTAKCRAEEGRVQRQKCWEGGVAEHRAADAASTADLSAVRIEDLTRRILEKTAHGGLMGWGRGQEAYYEGHFAPTSLS
jgi:hypothetical protein